MCELSPGLSKYLTLKIAVDDLPKLFCNDIYLQQISFRGFALFRRKERSALEGKGLCPRLEKLNQVQNNCSTRESGTGSQIQI